MNEPAYTRNSLAVAIVIGFMLSLAFLFLWPVPSSNSDIIIYMLGQLSGFLGAIVAFNYGTSKSSQDKNGLIHQRMTPDVEQENE